MHVLVLNYEYDADLETVDALLDRYWALTGWAEGLAVSGARVTVLQRFGHDARAEHDGIVYRLMDDGYEPRLRGWQVPLRLHRLARALGAASVSEGEGAVAHVNGLLFPVQVRALRAALHGACAIGVQHHAEQPRSGLRGLVQRWCLGAVDGFLFAARELAREWVQQGSIGSWDAVYEVMELSSPFRYQDRAVSRAITGMQGDPVVLWTGNLYPNKDPLTILAGFERLLERAPRAHLYMAYRYASLLPQIEARIASSPKLRDTVTLLGTIPHDQIEAYYNSADLFVQGSAREGSGAALLDALACGVVPVVTDIPSFRAITDGGRIGALWPVGDLEALTAALLHIVEQPLAPLSYEARRFFEATWSFPAIGRQALAAYQGLIQARMARGGKA